MVSKFTLAPANIKFCDLTRSNKLQSNEVNGSALLVKAHDASLKRTLREIDEVDQEFPSLNNSSAVLHH